MPKKSRMQPIARAGKKALATDTAQEVIGAVVDGVVEVAVDKADDAANAVKRKAASGAGRPPPGAKKSSAKRIGRQEVSAKRSGAKKSSAKRPGAKKSMKRQVEPVPRSRARSDRVPRSRARSDRVPRSRARSDRVPRSRARSDRVPRSRARSDRVPRRRGRRSVGPPDATSLANGRHSGTRRAGCGALGRRCAVRVHRRGHHRDPLDVYGSNVGQRQAPDLRHDRSSGRGRGRHRPGSSAGPCRRALGGRSSAPGRR